MLYAMILAHLIGDYLLQTGGLARWKARSLMGVVAHGGVVTLVTLVCVGTVSFIWWPYALLIGAIHTVIDVVRARFLHTTQPLWELMWYLLDQLAHLIVIMAVVIRNGAPSQVALNSVSRLLTDPRVSVYFIGYILLLNPAWVLLRFTVRGVWGGQAAPHLGAGEKFGPMVERVLIASLVLLGMLHLVPLVLLPRRLVPLRIQGMGVGVLMRPTTHWAETLMSVSLAIVVGLGLRLVGTGV